MDAVGLHLFRQRDVVINNEYGLVLAAEFAQCLRLEQTLLLGSGFIAVLDNARTTLQRLLDTGDKITPWQQPAISDGV